MAKVRFLNAEYDPLTLKQTVDAMFQQIEAGQRGWLCTVNVAILMMMRSDPRLQYFVDRATFVVADGQPIVWASSWAGQPLPERVTGVDLVEAICARAATAGKRIFLLGATSDIVSKLAMRLQDRNPNLHVEFADGYFKTDLAAERADQVRAARTDILFVGMGVPRQELFIEEQWTRLGVGMAIGVGGSFDVLAGLRKRAPIWVQRLGMEWLFRLIQEPRRLLMRYVVTNSQFVYLVVSALIKSSLKPKR
jgi:N-acetylglucosaminyldiphosphoundecaprenol N-acetyl-beta-D-mannosaminyltransferase